MAEKPVENPPLELSCEQRLFVNAEGKEQFLVFGKAGPNGAIVSVQGTDGVPLPMNAAEWSAVSAAVTQAFATLTGGRPRRPRTKPK